MTISPFRYYGENYSFSNSSVNIKLTKDSILLGSKKIRVVNTVPPSDFGDPGDLIIVDGYGDPKIRELFGEARAKLVTGFYFKSNNIVPGMTTVASYPHGFGIGGDVININGVNVTITGVGIRELADVKANIDAAAVPGISTTIHQNALFLKRSGGDITVIDVTGESLKTLGFYSQTYSNYTTTNITDFTVNDMGGGSVGGPTTVVDNLVSVATTDALSANQGRVLKNIIDGLPSNMVVANAAARDALTSLVVGDLVYVADEDGLGNWALHLVTSISGGNTYPLATKRLLAPSASGSSVLVNNFDPTIAHDSANGFNVSDIWLNPVNAKVYICVDSSVGAAEWKEFTLYGKRTTISANYTINDENIIEISPLTGPITVTLPDPSTRAIGETVLIINNDNNLHDILIAQSGGSYISPDTGRTPTHISTSQSLRATVISNGFWFYEKIISINRTIPTNSSPTLADDSTRGYNFGDTWYNSSKNRYWYRGAAGGGILPWFEVLTDLIVFAERSANHTAFNGEKVLVNSTGGPITITCPSSPDDGCRFSVYDSRGQSGINNITVAFGANNFHGSSGHNFILNAPSATVEFQYINSAIGWTRVK